MDIFEDFFSYLLRSSKKRKSKLLYQKQIELNYVKLSELKESLAIYASAIFLMPVEIRETNDFPYVSGLKIFLPEFYAISNSLEKNIEAYQVTILHLYAIAKIRTNLSLQSLSLEDEILIIEQLKESASILLAEEFPNYERIVLQMELAKVVVEFKEFGFNPNLLWGRLPKIPNLLEADDFVPEIREANVKPMTERNSKSKGTIKKVEFDENKENIGQDVFHHFEKVETVEEYKGIQRETDGSDQLAHHADAMEDLNLENVLRGGKSANSLYKTELDMGFEVTDTKDNFEVSPEIESFFYDEWDAKKRIYKKDWCRVLHLNERSDKIEVSESTFYIDCLKKRHVEINKLKKKLIQLASEIKVEKKLFNGRSIDIDNVIRNMCDRKHGNSGDQRYYQETKKRHRNMSTLLLIDTSLSADSWVQNRRILDVSLDALITFGEAAQSLGDPMMVAGFNSNTRNDCKFIEWKNFTEPWSQFTKNIGNIRPAGFTRIGPAIRHSTRLLLERKEKHKLLLVFTDGRPTDFDRYEGNYGLGDVRQAIREAEQEGVICFAIAIDPTAKQFLSRLFGLGNFQILHNLESLPDILTQLYSKLAKL